MVNELLEKIADAINDLCQQINLVHLKALRMYINSWNLCFYLLPMLMFLHNIIYSTIKYLILVLIFF